MNCLHEIESYNDFSIIRSDFRCDIVLLCDCTYSVIIGVKILKETTDILK